MPGSLRVERSDGDPVAGLFTARATVAASVDTVRVAAAIAVLALALAASVQARATTFRIQNDRGVPQLAQATVGEVGLTMSTNEAGEVEPASEPGDTVTLTRSEVPGPCGAPEGPVGVSYTVPDPDPDVVDLVLPALPGSATDPSLAPEERGLLGRINEQRGAAGLPPVVASQALAEAADGYATALGGDPAATTDHCRLAGPQVRAIDRGWPFDNVQELLAGAHSAGAALTAWVAEPSDRAALLEPRFGAIGVSRVGDLWVVSLSKPCGRLLGARCRLARRGAAGAHAALRGAPARVRSSRGRAPNIGGPQCCSTSPTSATGRCSRTTRSRPRSRRARSDGSRR